MNGIFKTRMTVFSNIGSERESLFPGSVSHSSKLLVAIGYDMRGRPRWGSRETAHRNIPAPPWIFWVRSHALLRAIGEVMGATDKSPSLLHQQQVSDQGDVNEL
jgi:hypothetical protein